MVQWSKSHLHVQMNEVRSRRSCFLFLFLYINFSVYFLFLIPFFPFRLFHFILFADSFPLCEDFAITYSSNLLVCARVCVCGTA